ncbi:hypothetical protein ElyMa_002839400 [Elysia marginata]|uniref:Uncharacterized protein n=1 Tax=Elysia marginata TaxID=1093978 RepID=A0AAV4HXL0_9GAST|nr:hypothetical protein ElyMa_002839400 [Elysia marginata]
MALILFILLNVLISILVDSFAVAREAIKDQANDFELLDYMASGLKLLITAPFHKVWHVTHGSCSPSGPSRKSGGGPGEGSEMTVQRSEDPTSCQESLAVDQPKHSSKPCPSRNVTFSPSLLTESPIERKRLFTPEAGKHLKGRYSKDSSVDISKILKISLLRELPPSVDSMEENAGVLDRQIDLIDARLDRLWWGFAGAESGPPPELDDICRWSEVKVTVADVIADHMGYQDDSDVEEGGSETIERSIYMYDSDGSVESEESCVEMSIARFRRLDQREMENVVSMKARGPLSDKNFGLKIYSGLTRNMRTLGEEDVWHDISRSHSSKEIVALNQGDLFLDNDIYLSREGDFSLSRENKWDLDKKNDVSEFTFAVKTEKERQDQVVPYIDISQLPGHGETKQEISIDICGIEINGAEFISMPTERQDLVPQSFLKKPFEFEEIPDEITANDQRNMAIKSETRNRIFDKPLSSGEGTELFDSFLLETPKHSITELDVQLVDETKSSLKPVSLFALENELNKEPKYHQRKKKRVNLDSPVVAMIRRTNNKKKAEGKLDIPCRATSTPIGTLNTNSQKGMRPASWPKATPATLDNLDDLIGVDVTPGPAPNPSICVHFQDVEDDTSYQRDSEFHRYLEGDQIVPTLRVTPASLSDSHIALEKDDAMFQPINKNLLMTPTLPCFSTGSSPINHPRLTPALIPCINIVNQEKVAQASIPDPEMVCEDDDPVFQPLNNDLLMTPSMPCFNTGLSPQNRPRPTPALIPRINIVDEESIVLSPSRLSTPKPWSSPRKFSSLSAKSPILLNPSFAGQGLLLTPSGNSRRNSAFAIGALAAAPTLSKRRLQTKRALANTRSPDL